MLKRWWMPAVLGGVALGLTSVARAQEESVPQGDVRVVRTVDNAESDAENDAEDVLLWPGAPGQQKRVVAWLNTEGGPSPGKYWIGVSCEPVSESLRSQLELEAGVGLVVNEVMADSPAKAAGLQPYDVLVAVAAAGEGDEEARPLKVISGLSEQLQKTEKKPLSLVVIRKGKRQTIEVIPAERPETADNRFEARFVDVDVVTPHASNPERVQALLRQLQEELGGGPQGVRLHMAAPVVVAAPPHGAPHMITRIEKRGLPDGMTLTITKTGNKPARIEVKKGEGQVWGANEDEIDTLPEEARELARSALAGLSRPHFNVAVTHGAGGQIQITPPVPPVAPTAPVPPLPPEAMRKVQQHQLEVLQKQIQDLTAAQAKLAEQQQKQLRELQQALEKLAPKE